MTDLLAVAMTLLCAWSQPHCQAVQQARPTISPTVNVAMGHGIFTIAPPATTTFGGSQVVALVISDQLHHPVAIAALLAHEGYEIEEVQHGHMPPNGHDCDGFEGWSGEDSFLTWFTATFGPPSATVGSMDNFVLQSVGQHPSEKC